MKIVVLGCVLTLVGCSVVDRKDCYLYGERCRDAVPQQEVCSVTSGINGADIVCPDGSSVRILNGKDGTNGKDGINGKDGTNGKDGINGKDGTNGKDGESCSVQKTSAGAIITCSGSTVTVLDGSDGRDALVDVIVPCADGSDRRDSLLFKEILLAMSNGKIYAYFEMGSQRFLTELIPGAYQTTDGGACRFDIDSEGRYVMY